MVVNKRKKFSRYRASHTHGGGHKKKRRGAGNRGGRGKAGSGKRGDANKPSFWKDKSYPGKKKGFVSRKKSLKTINVSELMKFSKSNIDLKELGYDKLLGTGNLDKKYNITVDYASKKAIDKIKQLGGEVSGLKEKKEKKKKEQKKKEIVEEEVLEEKDTEKASKTEETKETEAQEVSEVPEPEEKN